MTAAVQEYLSTGIISILAVVVFFPFMKTKWWLCSCDAPVLHAIKCGGTSSSLSLLHVMIITLPKKKPLDLSFEMNRTEKSNAKYCYVNFPTSEMPSDSLTSLSSCIKHQLSLGP